MLNLVIAYLLGNTALWLLLLLASEDPLEAAFYILYINLLLAVFSAAFYFFIKAVT